MSEDFTEDEIRAVLDIMDVGELTDEQLDKIISFERKGYMRANAGLKPKKEDVKAINLFSIGLKKRIDNSDLGDI